MKDGNFCSKALFLCQFLVKNVIKHWHFLYSADNVKDQRCFIKRIFKVKRLPSITHKLMLQSNGIKCNILSRSCNSFIQNDEHIDNSPHSEKTVQFSLATRTAPTLQNFIRRRSFPEVTADKCSQWEHTFPGKQ